MEREMIMMKKWIPSLAAGAVLTMSASICAAAVPSSALVAGGIEYGASADYVRQVYGTPTEVETKHHTLWNGEVTEYEYGDSFELKTATHATSRSPDTMASRPPQASKSAPPLTP